MFLGTPPKNITKNKEKLICTFGAAKKVEKRRLQYVYKDYLFCTWYNNR